MSVSERGSAKLRKAAKIATARRAKSEREGRSVTLSGFVNSWLALENGKKGVAKTTPTYRQKRECVKGAASRPPQPPTNHQTRKDFAVLPKLLCLVMTAGPAVAAASPIY